LTTKDLIEGAVYDRAQSQIVRLCAVTDRAYREQIDFS